MGEPKGEIVAKTVTSIPTDSGRRLRDEVTCRSQGAVEKGQELAFSGSQSRDSFSLLNCFLTKHLRN